MHIPVLLKETIEGLELKKGETLVDCTFGLGGHSSYACSQVADIKIIGFDLNNDTLEVSAEKLKKSGCDVVAVRDDFRNLDQYVSTADKFLFDLGWSSVELEESGRGFSFMRDEPLLMTYKDNHTEDDLTARIIVNEWQEDTLETILTGYGEEKLADRIAKGIVEARRKKPINTTLELVEVIKQSVPFWYRKGKIHYATRTFQALRIAVNDELEGIKLALPKAFERLRGGGRIAVISFHSLEDRIIKNYFRDLKDKGLAKIINKKPIVASSQELKENPRARSAKLRIIEKI